MLHLYSLTGEPTDKHCLLMNGDLVDRGSWSIEVILTAFAFKCESHDHPHSVQTVTYRTRFPGLYPKTMYINRGNHETKDMNRTYGFEGEAKHKHGDQSYKVLLSAPSMRNYLLNVFAAVRPCFHYEYEPSLIS